MNKIQIIIIIHIVKCVVVLWNMKKLKMDQLLIPNMKRMINIMMSHQYLEMR